MSNSTKSTVLAAYSNADQRHRNMFTCRIHDLIIKQYDGTLETAQRHIKDFDQHIFETLGVAGIEQEIVSQVGTAPDDFYPFVIDVFNCCVDINRVAAGRKPLGTSQGSGCLIAVVIAILAALFFALT